MNGSARRRSLRDWLVDFCLFASAVAWGFLTSAVRIEEGAVPGVVPVWLFNLDQLVGVLGCAALWLRRRWPTGLAVTLVLLSAYFEMVAGAMLAALFTVAVHRPPRTGSAVFALSLLTAFGYVLLRPEPGVPGILLFLLGAAFQGAATGWGLFVHHRRRLVASLRERAERAEVEARLRVEQTQREVREEIAREIHDVLGHRLSLLSVHAGALEYRPDAPAEDVARAARVIRESSHRALQDLREVIGVLRAPVGELPQPAFADIRQLVDDAERAGTRVRLRDEVAKDVPDPPGRTAYRVVQEALTNARKHAPGGEVDVRVTGAPGSGLEVEVVNAAPVSGDDGVPGAAGAAGAGRGLVGLAERVSLAGGSLEHGPTADGGWRVAARLPWLS
ncbi:sensor histidine kinase [Thermobifida halotolerans]|uniref:histidine kinase n=1 Tax=Thermobifida halotolerans TaxID=483545 RepID=A0A399G5C3_9ACTN|nr:histidine kinase [Thermobifida halotolerans]UOE17955.1 sensor histidine kinase [Thermobifida halotolerans]